MHVNQRIVQGYVSDTRWLDGTV